MIGAEAVAQALRAAGVTFVSTLCGNGVNPILHATKHAGLRVVDCHNEQTAGYMAEVYGRFTGKVGVCAVSASVGHTNALSGVVNAWFDGAPMLLLSGASEHTHTDRGKFQDFDQVALAAQATKYARFIDHPSKIIPYLHEALSRATAGRPGPVHLTIPNDVLEADVPDAEPLLPRTTALGAVLHQAAGSYQQVMAAADAVSRAQRPLLIAGSGVFYARGADHLAEFVERTGIPVMTPIWDRGSVTSPIPQYMGVVGSASGSPALLREADLVILAGARVDYRLGYFQTPAVRSDVHVIRISVDPAELYQGISPDIAIQGDPGTVLEQLCALVPPQPGAERAEWLARAREVTESFRRRWQRGVYPDKGTMTGWHVVDALRPYVYDGSVLIVDGGNIGQWAHMMLTDCYPGHWMTCGASGVVGYGIAAGMAARLAYPDRHIILLSGDGSMGFNTADLESAARQGLPFTIVVADDQKWGITASNQNVRYGADDTVAVSLGPIRFDLLAQALGWQGTRAEDPAALAAALEQARAGKGPQLIHVPTAHGGPAD